MSDENSLAESAYELINSTDGESQDGRLAESVSSLDYPRTDDVQSLNGSSVGYQSDTDDEAEQHSSSSSIRYANEALQNPSTPPPTIGLQYPPPAQQAKLPQSIEFFEGDEEKDGPLFLGKISVKHTIREFTEEETATIAEVMNMSEAPKRLVATIRQTMSLDFLSTREPLRVVYTGSQMARMDIIYKISSAICASVADGGSDKAINQSTEGVFNIFPISDFGSNKLPDVHLLESSGRQIRVEDCTSAKEIIIEGGSFPGDTVYSLTVDGDKTYRSLFSPSGSTIQPRWTTLPHIAIFFCTENDDEHARNTRDVAWKFMNRHGIPSIFISNDQPFTRAPAEQWRDIVDQHAVHLCLESRNPERPDLSQRLPIDLPSFLNIDARQMNRNLTYLTGLIEHPDLTRSEETVTSPVLPGERSYADVLVPEPLTFLCTARRVVREYIERNPRLIPLATIIFGSIIAMLLAVLASAIHFSPLQGATISTVSPGFVPTVTSVVATRAPSTATTTVVINITSTKTVKIFKPEASASTLASVLSFAGFLSDKASSSVTDAETKMPVCSAERYSNTEILVKVPPGSKTSWLARGAIDIDVHRGEDAVKTKISSTDEGILVEIHKKDAYGLLNLSVVTTKKPKINETFEINFGKPSVVEAFGASVRILHDIANEVANAADEAGHYLSSLAEAADITGAAKAAQGYSQKLGESLNLDNAARLLKDAQKQLFGQLVSPDNLREDIDFSILKAQVASKLWWLKVQGKTEERAEYERNAAQYLRSRHRDMIQNRKARSRDSSREESHQCKSRKGKGCDSSRDRSKDGIWKRMVVG